MMQQGKLLESQRDRRRRQYLLTVCFIIKLSLIVRLQMYLLFFMGDTGEIQLCDGKLKLYLRLSVKKKKGYG